MQMENMLDQRFQRVTEQSTMRQIAARLKAKRINTGPFVRAAVRLQNGRDLDAEDWRALRQGERELRAVTLGTKGGSLDRMRMRLALARRDGPAGARTGGRR